MHRLILIPALFLTACGGHGEKPATPAVLPPAAVKAHTVSLRPVMAVEEIVGTVRAKQRAAVEAKVSGRILEYLAVPGQAVKEGDLLARLDVDEIEAKVTQARAVMDQAKRDTDRLRGLVASGATTRQDFESAEARQKVAAAALTEAETMLGYARVGAPFTGVITRKLADVGDFAMPGKPLLEIEAPDVLRFEADVPEAIFDRVKSGAVMQVTISSPPRTLAAKVSEISPVADAASRTFPVKFDLPVTEGLRSGQFGRVAVPVAETEAISVPSASLTKRGQMEIVHVISGGHAQLRLVRSGRVSGGDTEILAGLNAGEQIALPPAGGLEDGQPVTVTP